MLASWIKCLSFSGADSCPYPAPTTHLPQHHACGEAQVPRPVLVPNPRCPLYPVEEAAARAKQLIHLTATPKTEPRAFRGLPRCEAPPQCSQPSSGNDPCGRKQEHGLNSCLGSRVGQGFCPGTPNCLFPASKWSPQALRRLATFFRLPCPTVLTKSTWLACNDMLACLANWHALDWRGPGSSQRFHQRGGW